MTARITTIAINWEWRKGKQINAHFGNREAETFEGVIDFVLRNKKAGYDMGGGQAPYDVIEYLADYEVQDADAEPTTTVKKFDNFEDAINYYFNLDSHHRVIYQTRRLSNGATDKGVITYRWN